MLFLFAYQLLFKSITNLNLPFLINMSIAVFIFVACNLLIDS